MLSKELDREKKSGKGQKGKIKSLCRTMIVYFKCKGYSFEVNIVLSVKPKPKLYEWKDTPPPQNCAPAWGITMVLIFSPLFWFLFTGCPSSPYICVFYYLVLLNLYCI